MPAPPASPLRWPYHLTTQLILLRHPFAPASKGRNINRLPIGYGFRLSLRVPPNPGRTSLPQVPLGLRGEGFSPSSRYSCLHPHLDFVQQPSRVHLLPTVQRSPTNMFKTCSAVSVNGFSPLTSSAQRASTSELLRTLLRMAASEPTSWLS